MASNYAQRTGTGGPGSGVITNDDEFILDIEDPVVLEDFDYSEVKDDRSY